MSADLQKPVIGFTTGDLNGIGLELIIKALADGRVAEHCVPVIFANNRSINFYKKSMADINFSYQLIREMNRINNKQTNIFNCWEEEVNIQPGQLNETGGRYAKLSLMQCMEMLKNGSLQGIVTAPIHKKNIQSEDFNYTGHTPFFKSSFNVNDVLMFMTAANMRVGLVTEHVPVSEVAQHITKENIISKLRLMYMSLKRDFNITKPRIAVLGLNPHAGDEGLVGTEEENIIKPAIKEARDKDALVFGPYSADAFFARGMYESFDGVLAMYHDQGLIPFKSLAQGEGINYTAGLPIVRTSPDHGTAFDIAGKGKANASSFIAAIFECIDIINRRKTHDESRQNPVKKMSTMLVANAPDEAIDEEG